MTRSLYGVVFVDAGVCDEPIVGVVSVEAPWHIFRETAKKICFLFAFLCEECDVMGIVYRSDVMGIVYRSDVMGIVYRSVMSWVSFTGV